MKEGAEIPDGSLCVGVPARIVRELDDKTKESILHNAAVYVELGKEYRGVC